MYYLVMVLTGFLLIGIGTVGYLNENTIVKTEYEVTYETHYYDKQGKLKTVHSDANIMEDLTTRRIAKKTK